MSEAVRVFIDPDDPQWVPPPAPQPTTNTAPDVVDRLCEYDAERQVGCRRTQTIFTLEAEFDTFVSPEMQWGVFDLYCVHEGHLLYYKPHLQSVIDADTALYPELTTHPQYPAGYDLMIRLIGRNALEVVSMEKLDQFIKSQPKGMPKLIVETPHFYQCEGVGNTRITHDMIDAALLEKIKNTFTDDVNPLLNNVTDSLFLDGDNVVCTNVYLFGENPLGKLGFYIDVSEAEAKFFAFQPLTEEQTQLIFTLAIVEAPDKTLTVVNL